MINIQYLKEVDFFIKRALILEDNQSIGIQDVLLPKPMPSAEGRGLQLIIKTNDKYNLENRLKFLEKLDKMLGKEVVISVFVEANIKRAVEKGVGLADMYRDFLQSAIPIEELSESYPLDDQWRVQTSRAIAFASVATTSTTIVTPLASIATASFQKNAKEPKENITLTREMKKNKVRKRVFESV